MMAVVQGKNLYLAAILAVAFALVVGGSAVRAADPLVTGGLVLYYDFDSFTDTVMDGSGNGYNAKVQDGTRNVLDQPFTLNTTGVISNDTADFKRGTGAINFTQSTVSGEDPVFIDMDGGTIGATANMPTTAISFAAWVKPTDYSGDFTIFNGASGGHGVPHFQIQGGGNIRFTIRNQAGQNLVDTGAAGGHPYTNQPAIDAVPGTTPVPVPLNEWHHFAVSYDNLANSGAGQLDVFYDGVKIRTQGNVVPANPGPIGPWQLRAFSDYYDGLAIGSVYDSGGRRTRGWMDEAYIFNRKITDEEVLTLFNLGATLEGDYNGDGTVDAADYVTWRDDPAGNGGAGGYNTWRGNFGATAGAGSGLGAAAIPEPASLALVLLSLSFISGLRRR